MRARSEILAIWAARKQLSENINKAISTWCFPFVNIAISTDRTEQSYSGEMF